MKSLVVDILNKGIQTQLQSNKFAKALSAYLSSSDNVDEDIRYVDLDIEKFYHSYAQSDIEHTLHKEIDFRYKALYLNAFRKFPKLEDKLWGIDFNRDDNPVSAVFLGSNGCGKTSVYNALQLICTNKIQAAEIKGFKTDKDKKTYIPHVTSTIEDVELFLDTNAGVFSYKDSKSREVFSQYKQVLPSFFCAAYDISRLEYNQLSINDFIDEQIGLKFIKRLLSKLDDEYNEILKIITDFHQTKDDEIDIESKNEIIGDLFDAVKTILERRNDDDLRNAICQLNTLMSNSLRDAPFAYYKKIANEDTNRIKSVRDKALRRFNKEIELIDKIPHTEKIVQLYRNEIKRHLNFIDRLRRGSLEVDEILSIANVISDETLTLEEEEEIYQIFLDKRKVLQTEIKKLNSQLKNHVPSTEIITQFVETKLKTEFEWNKKRDQGTYTSTSRLKAQKYEGIVNDLAETKAYLNTELVSLINRICEIAKLIVIPILKKYIGENEKLECFTDNKTISFRISYIDENIGTISNININRYFNTFRYKIFCISLKFAIAYGVMKFVKIQHPIVVDDIFDASDFPNRINIKDFISDMCLQFYSLFSDDKTISLQVILFTHDEVVAQSFYSGLNQRLKGCESPIFARIYDCSEATDADSKTLELDNIAQKKYINIADGIR